MRPLKAKTELQDTYRRYVDSFQFYKNPEIQRWVTESRDVGRLLWREPFLTIAKPFAPGEPLQAFVDRGDLDPVVLDVFRKDPSNPTSPVIELYKHQSDAIATQVAGHNVAVATGTGSGKSLTFHIPVVSAVHRAKQRGVTGVKALLIYPMNALANSQYEDLARRLAGTGLTVCNYTSDLKDDREAALKNWRELTGRDEPYDSEVIDRVSMRGDGDDGKAGIPDILITNFKMLEYALVRFRDRRVFPFPDGDPTLLYLVLDEVHVYSGRQGADMAALVRRFKHRTGAAGQLRCVATSATIESGEAGDAATATAQFAHDLFGEPFDPAHVVTATYGNPVTVDPYDDTAITPRPVDETHLADAVEAADAVGALAALGPDMFGDPGPAVDQIRRHQTVAWLERALWDSPRSLTDLVEQYRSDLRPDISPEAAETELLAAVAVAVAAKIEGQRGPEGIITPKIHLFFSQGSQVVSCARPGVNHLSDTGSASCRLCADEHLDEVPAYPLAFCAACGQEYLVAERVGDYLAPREFRGLPEDDGTPVYLMPDTWDQAENPLPEGFLASATRADRDYATPQSAVVCGRCGRIGGSCEHTGEQRPVTIVTEPFLFCPSCGVTYDKRSSEWNKLFLVGAVGRSTATDVFISKMLASAETPAEHKVIAFTDNRQDSSFQAAHLNALSRRFHLRRALHAAARTLTDNGTPEFSHAELASKAFDLMETARVLPQYTTGQTAQFGPAAAQGRLRYLRYLEYGAIVETTGRAHKVQPSLESVGLLEVAYPDLAAILEWAQRQGRLGGLAALQPGQQRDVLRAILDTARRERALAGSSRDSAAAAFMDPARFGTQVIDQLAPTAVFHTTTELPRVPTVLSDTLTQVYGVSIRRIAGKQGSPSTSALLRWVRDTLLDEDGAQRDAQAALEAAVEILSDDAVQLLIPGPAGGMVLSVDQLSVRLASPDATMQRCPRCGVHYRFESATHCPRCVKVQLRPEQEQRADYFRDEYTAVLGSRQPIEAEEHSGQVSGEARKHAEQAFGDTDDPLNVLVCTPTMELGIDIGALSAVYMRNVPPTPANYAQRQGRAGRSGQASAVVTFCGSYGKFGPHDQYFFRFPEKIIAGKITAPRIKLDNDTLLEAHINAVVLGYLARSLELPKEPQTFVSLTPTGSAVFQPAFASELRTTITSGRTSLISEAKQTFAAELAEPAVRDDLVESTIDSFYDRFEAIYRRFRDDHRRLEQELADIDAGLRAPEGPRNRKAQRALRRSREAIESRLRQMQTGDGDYYPYSYLAQEGFLPNYAFPRRASFLVADTEGQQERIARGRSIALREFAPRNTVYFKGQQYVVDYAKLTDGVGSGRKYTFCGGLGAHSDGGCGAYISDQEAGTTTCPSCGRPLTATTPTTLMDMPDMYARPRGRVGADTEERLRHGYRIDAFYRMPRNVLAGRISLDDDTTVPISYAQRMRILQVNRGLRAAKDEAFNICDACGMWSPPDNHYGPDAKCGMAEDHLVTGVYLVTEGNHDALLIDLVAPAGQEPDKTAVTMLYALRGAIGITYGLDDSELSGEIYPHPDDREDARRILIYETDEGSLGALATLATGSRHAWRKVVATALELLHEPPGGPVDERACVDSCYECLRSFYNQWHHGDLDRRLVIPTLRKWLDGSIDFASPANRWTEAVNRYDSAQERDMVDAIRRAGLPAPDAAHHPVPEGGPHILEADLWYKPDIAVLLHGSVHDTPDMQETDRKKEDEYRSIGGRLVVIRHDKLQDGITRLRQMLE